MYFSTFPFLSPSKVTQDIDYRYGIAMFDRDNLYPQRMHRIMQNSPVVKSAVDVTANFINGEGFENNGDQVVNEEGQTLNDILLLCAEDFAEYLGYSIHMNFSGEGKAIDMTHIPFEYVRFGLPDQKGVHSKVKISNNWERNSRELPQGSILEPEEFPLFNPLTAGEQTLSGGKGQVFYYTGNRRRYPLCSFDPVVNYAITDAEIQQFLKSNIQNGFLGTTLFKYPGQIEDDKQRKVIEEKIRNLQGSYGANSILLIEAPEDFTGNILENAPANNNDRLFELTTRTVIQGIVSNFKIPTDLLAILPDGAFITQERIKDSHVYYNLVTKGFRDSMTRAFTKIASIWGGEGSIEVGSIKEQTFIPAGLQTNQFTPTQLLPNEQRQDEEEEEPVNKLKKLYG